MLNYCIFSLAQYSTANCTLSYTVYVSVRMCVWACGSVLVRACVGVGIGVCGCVLMRVCGCMLVWVGVGMFIRIEYYQPCVRWR